MKNWIFRTKSSDLQKQWRAVALAILMVGAVLMVLEASGAMSPLTDQVRSVTQPLQTVIAHGLRWGQQRVAFATRVWDTAERAAQIEVEYIRAQAQLSELAQLRDENDRLKRQLGQAAPVSSARLITVPIVSYPYRLVSVGQQHGVREGDEVFANQVLLGSISSVGRNSSRVQLLTDGASPVLVVRSDSGITGLVKSKQGSLVFTEIPHTQTVRAGERVVTMGQEGIDPGLFIGLVGSSLTAATDSVQSFLVEPGVSFDTADVVVIR